MPDMPDHTHDPRAKSWVGSANVPGHEFPVQNLPYAVFRRRGATEAFRGGVGIGDDILDLAAVASAGGLGDAAAAALGAASGRWLNVLMALGPAHWSALRQALFAALREGSAEAHRLRGALVPQDEIEFALPALIGDYTDFYASIHHAENVGRMLRPDMPLMPNYKHLPVGYHGRASSVVVSGTPVVRPCGQWRRGLEDAPGAGPSARLDYELELGIFIGPGNTLGQPIPIARAADEIFGLCLLNDWSARDIQGWEYQPLGPFLGKNFATTVSPWIVTMAALSPYRVKLARPETDPALLPYLDQGAAALLAGLDIHLEVMIETAAMRDTGAAPFRLSSSNARHAYWSAAQMIAHHTVNGCNLRPGDLLGTGTLSGPGAQETGSMLEMTHGGRDPIRLPGGEYRAFLEDGDAITLHGWCEREGARLGFGACVGRILPAPACRDV
jgi:fumarylacetoacetase